MAEEPNAPTTAAQTADRPANPVMERIINEGRMVKDESQLAYAQDMVSEYALQVSDHALTPGAYTVVAGIKDRIAQIDEAMSAQLNAILHDPAFQALEGAWRGLHYLVSRAETGEMMKLRLLNTTMKEITNDLEKAVEFDQSGLFKKIYEDEYGTFGGNPFSLLIGDFEFGRHPQDVATLEKLSNVAAAAHAPFLSMASAKMFDWASYAEMNVPRDLAKGFETAELVKWRSFRASEDSRYVTLVLPHFLLRLPYGPDTVPVDGFNYVEDVDGTDASKYLWGNAAYALGERICNAFSHYQWCAAIRGAEGGGLVEGLPAHVFHTAEGDAALKCPTEVAITDRREKELSDLGFIALCHRKGTDQAAFFGGQTTNKPIKYNTPQANANARISAMLPYMLASARFAHYLKVIMRDKIGSFMTKDNVAKYLNTWIADYVLLDDTAPQTVKANYPLREARVDVFDIPGKPGCYKAVVFLRPHFQLDELTASVRLVAELPPPAAK